MVRVSLHGRRNGGWVVGLAGEATTDRPLQPLVTDTGWGPPAEVISLARWAA
jgi:primosomal protein N' (replication factor Y)